jgi:hypothetical protein
MSNRNEENKINKSLLAELIKVAQADNDVRDIEFQFLLTIAAQLGVTVDDFKILFEQYIKFMPPKLEVDRIVQFHRLVLLMNVDLETSHLEINYIKEAGIRMGLNPLAIEQVLNEMNSFPNKIIPPERLLEIFQLYHN